jgi:prolipoprotein diacylglyceryltransferase
MLIHPEINPVASTAPYIHWYGRFRLAALSVFFLASPRPRHEPHVSITGWRSRRDIEDILFWRDGVVIGGRLAVCLTSRLPPRIRDFMYEFHGTARRAS